MTAALLSKRAGKRVAVLEARRLLGGVSGATSAHLTQVLDTRYHTPVIAIHDTTRCLLEHHRDRLAYPRNNSVAA